MEPVTGTGFFDHNPWFEIRFNLFSRVDLHRYTYTPRSTYLYPVGPELLPDRSPSVI